MSLVKFDVTKVQYANKRGGDVTKTSKSLRGQIRSNRDALLKHWPALKNHDKGNGYPPIPRDTSNAIVKYGVSGAIKRLDAKAKASRKRKPSKAKADASK